MMDGGGRGRLYLSFDISVWGIEQHFPRSSCVALYATVRLALVVLLNRVGASVKNIRVRKAAGHRRALLRVLVAAAPPACLES